VISVPIQVNLCYYCTTESVHDTSLLSKCLQTKKCMVPHQSASFLIISGRSNKVVVRTILDFSVIIFVHYKHCILSS
jgi:hypothetical protein